MKDNYSEIFNMNMNIPLVESNHSQYLATKTPVRKNKDFRPRPRNYVIGFPVYKKDCYTRHWQNLKDVLQNKEAPIVKYTKIFTCSYFFSLLGASLFFKKNLFNIASKGGVDKLVAHANMMQKTTYDVFNPFKIIKYSNSFNSLSKIAISSATFFTLHQFLINRFM